MILVGGFMMQVFLQALGLFWVFVLVMPVLFPACWACIAEARVQRRDWQEVRLQFDRNQKRLKGFGTSR
ncbi:hypothetical protein CSC82_08700 [Rhodobacteraceae bacterium 4F10]|nr:hypothetical protein CSC82_08700 [Rhodobacteraceae bacterium 4F10]